MPGTAAIVVGVGYVPRAAVAIAVLFSVMVRAAGIAVANTIPVHMSRAAIVVVAGERHVIRTPLTIVAVADVSGAATAIPSVSWTAITIPVGVVSGATTTIIYLPRVATAITYMSGATITRNGVSGTTVAIADMSRATITIDNMPRATITIPATNV